MHSCTPNHLYINHTNSCASVCVSIYTCFSESVCVRYIYISDVGMCEVLDEVGVRMWVVYLDGGVGRGRGVLMVGGPWSHIHVYIQFQRITHFYFPNKTELRQQRQQQHQTQTKNRKTCSRAV